ncbi:MAG: lactonase family protein [Bacteroidales bacterium]|nr:lactonase family protein [Bacteroidales bacterium]MBQ9723412.1 lactonase family protein [Bacteroidales bacterium]
MKRISILMTAAVIATGCGKTDDKLNILIGTYGENIYVYSFDQSSLEFTEKAKTEARNASYALAGKDAQGGIYAVSETGDDSGAYSFADDGKILLTSEKRQTGADPCFVLLHEGYMMTADYSGGSISIFPIMKDGAIGDLVHRSVFHGSGPVTSRQEGSHIHQLKAVPGHDDLILASDLGADRIRLLRFSTDNGSLTHIADIECPSGSGPRHMEFSKDGRMLYCIAELSGEVLVYEMTKENQTDEAPSFTPVQMIQADEVNAGGSADIHIHPDGTWLYTSHRLDNDGISIFRIKQDGSIEKTGYARTARHPRNFMITPDGNNLLVACRDDKVIQVFSIEKDGSLTLKPSVLRFDHDMPSSVTLFK